MSYSNYTVSTVPTLLASAKTTRLSIIITNTDPITSIFVGPDSAITTSNAIEIFPGCSLAEDDSGTRMYIGPFYAIAGASVDVRVWEHEESR